MEHELIAVLLAGLLGGGGAYTANWRMGNGALSGVREELEKIRHEIAKVRERLVRLETVAGVED